MEMISNRSFLWVPNTALTTFPIPPSGMLTSDRHNRPLSWLFRWFPESLATSTLVIWTSPPLLRWRPKIFARRWSIFGLAIQTLLHPPGFITELWRPILWRLLQLWRNRPAVFSFPGLRTTKSVEPASRLQTLSSGDMVVSTPFRTVWSTFVGNCYLRGFYDLHLCK